MSNTGIPMGTNRLVPFAGVIGATVLGFCIARAQQPPAQRADAHPHAGISGEEAGTDIAMVSTADSHRPNETPAANRIRPHQLGQDKFRGILADDLDWKPFAAFPPSVRLAVVVGQPSENAPYTIRVKVPGGVKLMPHKHPEDRVYTVLSGVFYIGLGEQFDPDKLTAYPPGSVIVLPGNTPHFHWAKSGEYVSQITAIGPLGLEYLDPKDDPRNVRSNM